MLVLNSERDGTHNLIPHSALDRGKVFDQIAVNCCYTDFNVNGHRQRLMIKIFSNATLYELKQTICQQMAYKQVSDNNWEQQPIPHPWTLRVVKTLGNTTLKDTDNGKTLSELGFKSDTQLQVFKKGAQSVSKMPLLTPENKLNDRAKFHFTKIFERYAIPDPDDST